MKTIYVIIMCLIFSVAGAGWDITTLPMPIDHGVGISNDTASISIEKTKNIKNMTRFLISYRYDSDVWVAIIALNSPCGEVEFSVDDKELTEALSKIKEKADCFNNCQNVD